MREADALVKCLAFDPVTAWRVFSLERYARDAPGELVWINVCLSMFERQPLFDALSRTTIENL